MESSEDAMYPSNRVYEQYRYAAALGASANAELLPVSSTAPLTARLVPYTGFKAFGARIVVVRNIVGNVATFLRTCYGVFVGQPPRS